MNVREAFLGALNATAVVTGSKALVAATAADLSATATAYTGGVIVTNGDTLATAWINTVTTATVAGADCYQLGPGASAALPVGDLRDVSAISSGTPTLSWIGVTL